MRLNATKTRLSSFPNVIINVTDKITRGDATMVSLALLKNSRRKRKLVFSSYTRPKPRMRFSDFKKYCTVNLFGWIFRLLCSASCYQFEQREAQDM